ncbi:MAG: shikimate kinase [Candidatus Riflebacteria bacterium]|jgi:shikimate kinase|nr:shikimate kinase [Candidatus Riflebacteria bacterium]
MRLAILLTGFMASGKTTAGTAAAKKLGLPFVDLDLLIEQTCGKSILQIFADSGEKEFRKLENRVFIDLLHGLARPMLIACGGGLPVFAANHLPMKNCRVIFLDTPWRIIENRLATANDSRPLINGKTIQEIRKLYDDRHPVYLKHSEFVIQEEDQIFELVSKIIAGATKT